MGIDDALVNTLAVAEYYGEMQAVLIYRSVDDGILKGNIRRRNAHVV
jgi:hypothetical protein